MRLAHAFHATLGNGTTIESHAGSKMKPETFFLPDTAQTAPSVRAGLLGLGLLAILALLIYWPTAWSMVEIWSRSDTFAHGYLVLPVVLWLIWQERNALASMRAKPMPSAALMIGVAGFLWLAAQLSSVVSLGQFALVIMLQCSALALLGSDVCRRLALPLLFLFFAVPFGEFLLPTLIDRTADASVVLLKVSGVPVYREGNHLHIPTGQWAVVEACSGLRYLIASLFGGMIYAYVRYQSRWRRVAFIAASIGVPIIANWLRAYGIIMLGHHTNNRLGVSVDHLIYGWLFFGVVMLLLFWVGSFWAEDPHSAKHSTSPEGVATGAAGSALPIWRTAAVCLAVIGIWPIALHALDSRNVSAAAELHALAGTSGWQGTESMHGKWTPHFVGAHAELIQRFERDGQPVELYIAYYRNQQQGSELIASKNQLVYANDKIWRLLEQGVHSQPWRSNTVRAQSVVLRGNDQTLKVRELYWIDGRYTGSKYAAKALVALSRLTGRGDDSAAIVISTFESGKGPGADEVLDRFSADMSTSIDAALTRARENR